MSEANSPNPSLLQLAISLRLAAQRLAESAGRMQHAASHQRQQLDRLLLLRDRIVELLGECRRLCESQPPSPAGSAPARPGHAALPPTGGTSAAPRPTPSSPQYRLPASAFVEFTNWQEFEKFRRMPPISDKELTRCDLDELIRRLGGRTD
jgi:hypothetical protein